MQHFQEVTQTFIVLQRESEIRFQMRQGAGISRIVRHPSNESLTKGVGHGCKRRRIPGAEYEPLSVDVNLNNT